MATFRRELQEMQELVRDPAGDLLEPIPHGTVTAEAYVLRSSRRSAYAEVDIWAAGKLAARANTTYMIRDSIS